jgi:hypothetical protein
MWLRSAATPGVTGAISYRARSEPAGRRFFSNRARAWPMPPAAPITATFMGVLLEIYISY